MTPKEISDKLEVFAIEHGLAWQRFYHDGWKFLVEVNHERNGYGHVIVLKYVAPDDYYKYLLTTPRVIDANTDENELRQVAVELIAEARADGG